MRDRIWEIMGGQIVKRQVVANRYLPALGSSISILSHFQIKEGCGDNLASILNPSSSKVFGTHTFYEGPPPMISKMIDSTTFNFGRPLGLSTRGKSW